MKIVIPGGSGKLGGVLVAALRARGHELVVLSRSGGASHGARGVRWDGATLGDWAAEIDGADAVINLAGRSVDCRYTAANLKAMLDSRVDSTRVVGEAIERAAQPPAVWLQMSTATIYAHRFDAPNDEASGAIGGHEPDVPAYWQRSVEIAQAWEAAQQGANTPRTRRVALRTAMVMSPDAGSVFSILLGLTRWGLGGSIAGGRQYVSWIHAEDFVRAVEWLLTHDVTGAVNLSAPTPLPQAEFMRALRAAWGTRFGLPASKWMVEIGAFVRRSDSELLLKSRRVVPGRLLEAGFRFRYPAWPEAAADLVARSRSGAERRVRVEPGPPSSPRFCE